MKNFVFSAIFLIIYLIPGENLSAQTNSKAVIAYYDGSAERLDSFDVNLMTHIIYCFAHLEGNNIKLGSYRDTLTIQKMVSLKSKNPALKY